MHELPKLPYDFKDLEPHIDAQTMEIHHGKHHATYVIKLNDALKVAGGSFGDWDITKLCKNINEIPDAQRTAVRNNGGGHYNHTLFWNMMSPKGGGTPTGEIATALTKALGSFEKFQETITNTALSRFGSGWTWLCLKSDKTLCVCSTPNQDNPLMKGLVDCPGTPLLGLDVWEHAYYLKYQNRRPEYIENWWKVVKII